MSIPRVCNGKTDQSEGQQTTFIAPDFPEDEIKLNPQAGPTVHAAKVTSRRATTNDCENNVMLYDFQKLQPNTLTVWRYQVQTVAPDGNCAIGFTSASHFDTGYKCKSVTLRQQGNVCSRGCFKSSWGERYAQGDVIDLYLETYADRIVVHPVKNDRPFGKHFVVEFGNKGSEIQNLCPLACFGAGDYSMIISEMQQVPIPPTPFYKVSPGARTSPVGSWRFRRDFNPTVPDAPWEAFTLFVSEDGSVSARIRNVIRLGRKLDQGGRTSGTGSHPTMTRMFVPGPAGEVERLMQEWPANFPSDWALEQDGYVLRIGTHRFDLEMDNVTIPSNDNVLIE